MKLFCSVAVMCALITIDAYSPALEIFKTSTNQVPIEGVKRMDEVPICETEYRWVNLSQAETIDGKRVFLASGRPSRNIGKMQSQWFYLAYCKKEQEGKPCNNCDSKTDTLCRTQFGVTVALVQTESGPPVFDDIQVPTACICLAKVEKKLFDPQKSSGSPFRFH